MKYLKLGLGVNMHVNIKIEGLTKEQGKGFAELKDFSADGSNFEVVFSAFSRFTIEKATSQNVEGHENDRELQLVFGGVPQGQSPATQDCIVYAQCISCLGVLETGLEEKIDPAVHYTCNKCPKEHAVGEIPKELVAALEQADIAKDNELDIDLFDGEDHPLVHKSLLKKEIDIADIPAVQSLYASHIPGVINQGGHNIPVLNPGVYQPNYYLLNQEIDWKNLAEMESVIMPPAIVKKEEKVEEIKEIKKEEKKPEEVPIHKPQEEKLKPKEDDYSVIIKEKSVEIPVKKEEKVNGTGIVQQTTTTAGDDDEEEEEEDEEHDTLLDLYVCAKEEFEMNNFEGAMVLYEEIFKNPAKLDKILLGKCQKNLDVCIEKVGGDEKKVEKLLKVLEDKKKSLGKGHPEVKATYKELAILFSKLSVETE